ncbi:MAG: PspC domain-containing protein [Nanoarchaeota archaeon]|nr:PspC domain-containing protein [Nanoarchaeota archaeon]
MEKLYRSKERVLAGVCGGLANYFKVDPVLIRLIFLFMMFTGIGILFYIIAWVIVPETPGGERVYKEDRTMLFGAFIVGLGVILLMDQVWPWIQMKFLIPIVIIIVGFFIMVREIK